MKSQYKPHSHVLTGAQGTFQADKKNQITKNKKQGFSKNSYFPLSNTIYNCLNYIFLLLHTFRVVAKKGDVIFKMQLWNYKEGVAPNFSFDVIFKLQLWNCKEGIAQYFSFLFLLSHNTRTANPPKVLARMLLG